MMFLTFYSIHQRIQAEKNQVFYYNKKNAHDSEAWISGCGKYFCAIMELCIIYLYMHSYFYCTFVS